MSALSINPFAYPRACEAAAEAEALGFLVAAWRRDGFVQVRITDTTDWAVAEFQVLGGDKAVADAIDTYALGWHKPGVAS